MHTRPAWGVLFLGAMIVIALLVSPLWLDQLSPYIEEQEEQLPFPEAFYLLPPQLQDLYNDMFQANPQMAYDLVIARLAEPFDVQEPNLPVIDANPGAVQFLLTGDFVTIDPLRQASGVASIYRLSDGRALLRLETLDAIIGSEMRVLISAYANPTTQEELDQVPQFEIDLGPLKGSQGNQNYIILDPVFNIDNYLEGSVVLYDARYEIVFSYASLRSPDSLLG
ncbi:MAG: hypothetical protein JW966_11085 [Anaerolineae bacterium]|nr:hypothetical protein [Anaerolineae bacterium]